MGMDKRLFALPFLAFALIAAKSAPPAPVKPPVSINAPAEVAADPANRWTLELSNGGKVVVQLRPDIAPAHVYRIQLLTSQGFYNGLAFHRVIPGFMAQGGDPQGTGNGGSKLPDLAAEFNDLPHLRGVASMARTDQPNTANSQFFIMLAPRHVYRIQQLTSQGFYNGLTFHRVIPGFMAQGGDPQGSGQGGSPLPDLAAEFSDLPHLRGVASMARAESPDSANSQFFIVLAPTFKLDHKYSAFGRVI